MAAAVATMMENWRRKSFEVSMRSDDVIVPVMMKAFDAMAAAMESPTNTALMQRTLESFQLERQLSVSYDDTSDPVRELTYDILEAIHHTIESLVEKSRGEGVEVSNELTNSQMLSTSRTPSTEDTLDQVHCCIDEALVVKEEKVAVEALEHAGAGGAVEEQADDVGDDDDVEEIGCQPHDRSMTHDVMKEEEEDCVMEEAETDKQSPQLEIIDGEWETVEERAEEEAPDPPSPLCDRAQEGDHGREAEEMGLEGRREEPPPTPPPPAHPPPPPPAPLPSDDRSILPILCILCRERRGIEFRLIRASSVHLHLERGHRTCMAEAGLAFRCECGVVEEKEAHFAQCASRSVSIVRVRPAQQRYAPSIETMSAPEDERARIRKLNFHASEQAVKCPLCQWDAVNLTTVVSHLRMKHGTSVAELGMWFRCGCGKVSQSAYHWNLCTHTSFTIESATAAKGLEMAEAGWDMAE